MRTLAIVVSFLAVLGVGTWYLLGDTTSVQVPTAAAEDDAAAGDARAAAADADAPATGAGAATDEPAPSRVEAATASAEPAVAVIGRVVGADGRPVEGAEVREAAGRSLAPDSFDGDWWGEFEGTPAEAVVQRLRAQGEGATATTGADGSFRLPVTADERPLRLRVAARGFRVLEQRAARPTTGEVDVGALQLTRGAVVAGRVVDRAGNGIATARVALRAVQNGPEDWFDGVEFSFDDVDMPWGRRDEVETDAEGWFELPHAPPGEFRLRARHDDHPAANTDPMQVAAGAELRDVLVVLEPGATIRGRVTGVPDGVERLRVGVTQRRERETGEAGPAGAFVFEAAGEVFGDFPGAQERTVDVGADGSFVLRGLRVGQAYRLWATEKAAGMFGAAACTPRLEVAAPAEGITLRYDPGVRVTFQVVDADTGAPIEELWVGHRLRGGGGMADLIAAAGFRNARRKTWPEGRVTLDDLRPNDEQKLELVIDALGHRRLERENVELPQRGVLDLGVVRLAPSPALRVRVVDADGQPVAKARVRVRDTSADDRDVGVQVDFGGGAFGGGRATETGRSDADGRCVLNAPVDASFVVGVTHGDFAPHESEPLRLSPSGADYVATLSRGGSVVVTVVDADGKPADRHRVDRRGPEGSDRGRETTDENGVATFSRLVPGEHRFRLGGRSGGDMGISIAMDVAGTVLGDEQDGEGWQTVRVEAGGRAELQLVRPASAELRGVVRENGVPLADARVTLLEGSDDGPAGELAGMMAEFGQGGGRSARVADDGSYKLQDVPEGSHRLRITSRSRAMPAVVPIVLRAGENVCDVELDVAIVRGIVRGGDGQPLEGVRVQAAPVRDDEMDEAVGVIREMVPMDLFGGGGRSAKTDATGRYELRGLQTGVPLQVRATAKRHVAASSAALELTPGAVRDGVDLQLEIAGRVKVTSAEKSPFLVAAAQRLGEGGAVEGRPIVQMLRSGSGTLDGLAAGRWRVTLQVPTGESPAPKDVDVVAGETVELAF